MASAFKQSVFSWVSATALAGAALSPILVQAQVTNPSGFGLRPSVELNLSVVRSLTDGTAQPPASIAPALPSPIIANPIAATQQPVAAPVQATAAPAPLDALPSAQYPAAQPAFSAAPHLDPGLVQPTPVVTPVPVQVAAPPSRKVPSQQPYVPPRSLPVYTSPAQTPNQAYALATAQPAVTPMPAPQTPPVSYNQAYTPPPVVQQPAPLSALPPVAVPQSVTASRSVAPPVAQSASTPKFSASPLQHGFAVPDEPIPIRVTHLVPFQRGESQAYKLSGASSKNTTGESTAAAEARWSQLSATEKAASPEFQVAVSDLRIRSNAKAGVVPKSKSDLPENANIRERDLIALANERPEPPAKPVVRYEKPVPPPAKKDKPKPKPAPKKPKTSAPKPAVSVPPPPVVNVKAKPKPVSKDSVKKPVPPPAKKVDTKPSEDKMAVKKPAPKLDAAKSDATAPPPKIPPLVKPELVNAPKAISPPPPPPDLVVPDLSNVAPPPPLQLAPPKPDAGELADVTPDKLLAPDALVVKREEPALLPEISVPQKGDASKNDTANAPGLPLAPDAGNVADAAEVGLLASLSNRISDLVTKEPEQQGVLKDETRIINPLEKAGQQSEKLTDAADSKVDKKTVAPAPALELPANLPSPDLALTPPPVDAAPASLPPVILPHEAVAKPEIVDAKRPAVIAAKPDVSEPKVAAASNLPSLDALQKNKKPTSDKMLQTNDEPGKLPGLPQLPAPVAASDNADGPVVTRGENATAAPAASSDAALEPLPDLPADDSAAKAPVQVAALQAAPLAPPPKAVEPKPKTPAKKAGSPSTRKPALGKPDATVTFSRDVTELNSDAKSRLIDLADDVKRSNKSVRIIAYAEGNQDQSSIARRVSLSRALQVRAFLIDKGVNQLKINVQARGNQLVEGTPNRADVFVRD